VINPLTAATPHLTLSTIGLHFSCTYTSFFRGSGGYCCGILLFVADFAPLTSCAGGRLRHLFVQMTGDEAIPGAILVSSPFLTGSLHGVPLIGWKVAQCGPDCPACVKLQATLVSAGQIGDVSPNRQSPRPAARNRQRLTLRPQPPL